MIKRSLLFLLAAAGIALIVILLRPANYHVERSAVVPAPAADVFAHLNDLRQWALLVHGSGSDTTMHVRFAGPASGAGASMTWSSPGPAGSGSLVITKSEPAAHIVGELRFSGTVSGTARSDLRLTPMGDSTRVTWALDGEHGIAQRLFALFTNSDAQVGALLDGALLRLAKLPRQAPATPLTLYFTLPAPREQVWRAWTDPAVLCNWWGPTLYSCPKAVLDVRPGGRHLIAVRTQDGRTLYTGGTYTLVEAPSRLAFTETFMDGNGKAMPAWTYGLPGQWPPEQHVTITLEDLGGTTRMTLEHQGIPEVMRVLYAGGWNESFEHLAQLLTRTDRTHAQGARHPA